MIGLLHIGEASPLPRFSAAVDFATLGLVRAPVVLVHGIWDTGKIFDRLTAALRARGVEHIDAIDLVPPDGSRSIADMASDVDRATSRIAEKTGATRVDLVGFSMGAVVSRYFVQRLGGRERVRRFISISGPHEGTRVAAFGRKIAAREMRIGSDLLRDLARDEDPWGEVVVHAARTPFDLMILPSESSELRNAQNRVFPVVLHKLMVRDRRVLRWIGDVLTD
jgi:pimeloyl-ACP methyl ester carboxylesterase